MARIYRRTEKKDLNDLDNHDGMITCLEPEIKECEVKWTLGSLTINKASGGDGIAAEIFQILKSAALNLPANLETQQWLWTEKDQFSFQSQR